MADPAPITAPALGSEGQPCPQCGEPLRGDQRYCLSCGRRRAQMRLAFLELAAGDAPPAGTPAAGRTAAAAGASGERSPLVALTALVALLLALGIGVLIGQGARDAAPAAKAPIVTVTPASAAAPFTGDWPAQTDGWTVSLRTLPATATAAEVTQAKQQATAAGATAVGALRSGDYPSLPAGDIVVYSGRFETKAAAAKVLTALRVDFPTAAVVRVARAAAPPPPPPPAKAKEPAAVVPKSKSGDAGSGLSPQEYQRRSKKLPDEVQSEGAPPPTDGGAPGGGSGEATEIG